jgi:hypothetical protein
LVTWGVLARPGFVVERVLACDADEALTIGAERRPELPRPTVALLATRERHSSARGDGSA